MIREPRLQGTAGVTEPSRQRLAAFAGDWGAPAFVGAVWALMLLAALVYVGEFTSSCPYYDDWGDMAWWTGQRPVTVTWLWSQHAEHRIPLPKLILLGLTRVASYDFRAGLFFNVVTLGLVAFALMRAARNLRGRTSYSDAFFPLTLLTLGQYEIFFISHAVDLVAAMGITGALLLLVARSRKPLTLRVTFLAAAGLGALTLCGAIGLALVPALTLWLVTSALLHWRSGEPHGRRNAVWTLTLAGAVLGLAGLYLVGWQKPPENESPTNPGLRATLGTSAEFLSMGFGPAAGSFWPVSGWMLVGLMTLTGTVLAVAWYRQPPERFRALGVLLFLGAMATLALAVGWGRAGFGPGAAFMPRYTTYAAPALCGAYLAWGLCRPLALGSLGQMVLFTLVAFAFSLNTLTGLQAGAEHRRQMEAFEKDLRAGLPPSALAERHANFVYPWPPDNPDRGKVVSGLGMLKRAGAALFRDMPEDPAVKETPFPTGPTAVHQLTWEEDRHTGRALGDDPHLVFTLTEPRMVCAIKVRYSVTPEQGSGPARFQLFWKRKGQTEFTEAQSHPEPVFELSPAEKVITVWAFDTIDQFRIHPDNRACVFQIREITLLVPATDS
jgi:hypothetical protein